MNETYAEGVPGIVLEVSLMPSGSSLTADHAIGATALTVDDIADFSESGGQLSIDGTSTILTYTSVDSDLNTILLAAPTTVLYEDTTQISVYPQSMVKMALVQTDEDEDGFRVRIPHALADMFVTGIREPEDQENVVVRLDGSTWVMSDASGVESIITGALFRTAEDGARWELGSSSKWYGDIRTLFAYSGRADEVFPAQINSDGVGITMQGPAIGSQLYPRLILGQEGLTGDPMLYKGYVYGEGSEVIFDAKSGAASNTFKYPSSVRLTAVPDPTYDGQPTLYMYSEGDNPMGGSDPAAINIHIGGAVGIDMTEADGVEISSGAVPNTKYYKFKPTKALYDNPAYLAGQEAFQALSFLNSWAAFDAAGTGHAQPGYMRLVTGEVQLRGLMKHATTTTTGGALQIPAGLEPSETWMFVVQCNGGTARVDVLANGTITVNNYNAGNGGFVSLAQVRWVPGQ